MLKPKSHIFESDLNLLGHGPMLRIFSKNVDFTRHLRLFYKYDRRSYLVFYQESLNCWKTLKTVSANEYVILIRMFIYF